MLRDQGLRVMAAVVQHAGDLDIREMLQHLTDQAQDRCRRSFGSCVQTEKADAPSPELTLVPLYELRNDIDPYVLKSGCGDQAADPEVAASNINHAFDTALTGKLAH